MIRLLAIVCGLLVVTGLALTLRRMRKTASGFCPECGHALPNVSSPRCPACGESI